MRRYLAVAFLVALLAVCLSSATRQTRAQEINQPVCTQYASAVIAAANTQLVTNPTNVTNGSGTATEQIVICGYNVLASAAMTGGVFYYGVGATCLTGNVTVVSLGALAINEYVVDNPSNSLLYIPAGQNLCFFDSGGTAAAVNVHYGLK